MSQEHVADSYDDIQAIKEQGAIVGMVISSIRRQTAALLDAHGDRLSGCRNVYITGCGDSYYAALAVEWHLQGVLKRPVRAIEALEFSRYHVFNADSRDLLIAISNSGAVARTVEAAKVADSRGLATLAVTGNLESDLAKNVEYSISQKVEASELFLGPQLSAILGLGNYLASLTSLLVFAYGLAERIGDESVALLDSYRDQVASTATTVEQTYGQCVTTASEWATKLVDCDQFFILGGGPNYATALFAAAKLFEQPRRNAAPIQMEEWAHEQFFLIRDGSPVFIIAPSGRSADRAYEMMVGVKEMGGILLVSGPAGNEQAQSLADAYFPVPDGVPEHLSPIPYSIPHQLFAAVLGKNVGRTYTSFASETQKHVNFRLIFDSAQRVLK